MGYGAEDHFLSKIIRQGPEEIQTSADPAPKSKPDVNFPKARRFMMESYEVAIRRWGDPNTFPFLHTILAFMLHCSRYPTAMDHLKQQFPWKLTAFMLNNIYRSCKFDLRIDSEEFPGPYRSDTPRPLPEDYAMRGLVYTEDYYPASWFHDSQVEEDEKYFELASMMNPRKERLLWIGRRLASSNSWLTWDVVARKFGVTRPYSDAAPDVQL